MKIFKSEPNIKFMNKRLYAFAISGAIIIMGFLLLISKDFNLGIDFTGGTLIEVSYKDEISVDSIRDSLKTIGMAKSTIQRIQNENKFFIKTTGGPEDNVEGEEEENQSGLNTRVKQALMTAEEKEIAANKLNLNDASTRRIVEFLVSKGIDTEAAADTAKKLIDLTIGNSSGLINDFSEVEKLDIRATIKTILKEQTFLSRFAFLSTETVGPQVGQDMRGKATRATIYALLFMLVYIVIRFKFIYGISAVITLLHDVLMTMTFILLFGIEVSLPVVAAILTIVGYSINDTIVIFDRVRDNVKLMRRENATNILDRSISQTLSRTIVTSGTTLAVVMALFFFGGEGLHSFSFTLLIGMIIGTYSSIFQSCAWLKIWENKFLGKKKANRA